MKNLTEIIKGIFGKSEKLFSCNDYLRKSIAKIIITDEMMEGVRKNSYRFRGAYSEIYHTTRILTSYDFEVRKKRALKVPLP